MELVPATLCASLAVVLLVGPPAPAWAYKQYSGKPSKDPCTQLGVGTDGGTLTRTYADPSVSETPVKVTLQCSPVLSMGRLNTLLANDLVAKNIGTTSGEPFFRGNVGGQGWLDTLGTPFVHGDIAEALRLKQFQASKVIVDALEVAGVTVFTSLGVSAIVCAAGGIPTLGLTCAAAGAAVGAAALRAVVAAAGSVIKDFIKAQFNRIKAMANADWFMWSSTTVTWNSFGNMTDTSIDPSFTNFNPIKKADVRIGVEFSSVPVGGGPDFFGIGAGTSAGGAGSASARTAAAAQDLGEQIRSLNFNAGRAGIDPNGRHRIRNGGPKRDFLQGGRGDDVLQAHGGDDRARGGPGRDIVNGGRADDVLFGGTGRDQLFGRHGDDRLFGGRGHDVLIGHKGRDVLDGGPGPDWLLDSRGSTVARTGVSGRRGEDFVNVRDGRGDDLVVCSSRRSTVVADAGDRIRGSCGKVIRTGPLLRMPG